MSFSINFPEQRDVHFRTFKYPAGEMQVRLLEPTITDLKAHDTVIVTAHITNGDLIELALLVDAIVGLGRHRRVVLVMPYLPYSRADRRFVEGDCAALDVIGGIIEEIEWDRLLTVDVHSHKAANAIYRLENLDPLPAIQWVVNLIRYTTQEPATLLLPDEGSKSRYDLSSIGMPVLQCSKKRNPETGELSGFTVPDNIHTRNVLIVDDLCDGGRTFLGIADELEKQYAGRDLRKYLYVTHGVFSQGFTELKKRFQMIYTTDSFKAWPKEDCSTYPIDTLISKYLNGDTKQEHENQAPIITCSDVDVPLA